ncbi:MAG: SPOR domain-containing protein [Chitinophagaceae bacterium]|nr:SPOR domain-containing protein [Chitinophagaceae bacterium]
MVTYSNFYSQNFQGIKRIKSGQVYYYNHDEWINDRTKMYTSAKNLVMTVSNVKITGNTGKAAQVNFTHGYSSNAYKDIGVKQIEIEKADDGRIYITKEEMLNSSDPSSDDTGLASFTDSDGKLVYKSDCFVIITGSFSYETDAKTEVRRMINEGYSNSGYLWIPDYPSLSGKQFYAPFIGPFTSYGECETNLKSLAKTGRFWYGVKVSFDNNRVEIR